ncbi:DNA glycosylase [Hydrogenoanaerobacterium sp.]|uniref:DNA-3-methyladenine glycosylase family protein n=1 Tax=Hydrogenoanaerobacterium sp. TaxID=2953763 RepID=UPI0028992D78|nr:DNA glycosylase [Hydrogenoanaerobacterium sp.]
MNSTICRLAIPAEEGFSLGDTLNCGQCFRWNEAEDGWFEGVVEGRFCRVSQDAQGLLLQGVADGEERFWADYFDLSTSYAEIRTKLCGNKTLAKAAEFAPGIRVLRQYPWETLCSFIISQNNNLARIRGIVARLCECFGDEISAGIYAFPTPERLAVLSESDLAPLRSGFRAKYILDAARKVSSGEVVLADVATMELDDARAVLQQIHGVGPKVAECALLYGFARMECFPMDVWMKRAMKHLFPKGLPRCARDNAGIAQQYIFHYARVCPDAFPSKL